MIFLYVDLYVPWTSECTKYNTSSMDPLHDPKLQALYICIHVCMCVADLVRQVDVEDRVRLVVKQVLYVYVCMHAYMYI